MNIIVYMLKMYLRFDKTQPFISITAILAFLGIGIGVMVLLVAMSIMNGMTKEFEKRIFVMNYPITIFAISNKGIDSNFVDFLENKFENMKFSPYVQTQAIARMNSNIYTMIIYGVDIKKENNINEVVKNAGIGEFNSKFPIIIGERLRNRLLLDNGDKMTLIFTSLTPTGITLIPKMKNFTLNGTFSSGIRSYDNGIVFSSIEAIRNLKGYTNSEFDGIHVYSRDPKKDLALLKSAVKEYSFNYPNTSVEMQGWWEQNINFFSAMELEKKALFIVLMLIILMASLNIISSLLMVVMNRRKEIALLISLGASKRDIKNIFFFLGIVIGGGGIIFGTALSFIVMEILKVFPIIKLPIDVYGISSLPIDLLLSDLIFTLIGAIIIVCISSFYPAYKASKINVLEVLRNE